MASELSKSVRSPIVILSKEGLSQPQIVARVTVSRGQCMELGNWISCIQSKIKQTENDPTVRSVYQA